MSSFTRNLTNRYGRFFRGCAEVAFCPYVKTYEFAAGANASQVQDHLLGIGACLFLTFAIPVLPELTTFTLALAIVGISLAISTMFVLYPGAILLDLCSPEDDHNDDLAPICF